MNYLTIESKWSAWNFNNSTFDDLNFLHHRCKKFL